MAFCLSRTMHCLVHQQCSELLNSVNPTWTLKNLPFQGPISMEFEVTRKTTDELLSYNGSFKQQVQHKYPSMVLQIPDTRK